MTIQSSQSLLFTYLFLFLGIWCPTPIIGQSLADVILDCKQVNGNVESSSIVITDWDVKDVKTERYLVQAFDKKKRLISITEYNQRKEPLLERSYHYVRNNMIKQEIIFLGKPQRSLFYQYNKGIPLKIMEINPKKELLSVSSIYLDSLYRPVLLKNHNLSKDLLYRQIAEYDEPNNRLLVQNLYPQKESYIYQYQMCSDDQYLETIPTSQFELYTLKTLKTTRENNITTIVKAVKSLDGKEDIHIQEIEFDSKDNWVKSNLYRLKKRKQKKVLLQKIERTLVYR